MMPVTPVPPNPHNYSHLEQVAHQGDDGCLPAWCATCSSFSVPSPPPHTHSSTPLAGPASGLRPSHQCPSRPRPPPPDPYPSPHTHSHLKQVAHQVDCPSHQCPSPPRPPPPDPFPSPHTHSHLEQVPHQVNPITPAPSPPRPSPRPHTPPHTHSSTP